MHSDPRQDTATVRMLDSAKPYSGFMKNAAGVTVSCSLSPGVHVLPVAKVEQLCRDFPDQFQKVAQPDPPAPESPRSSKSAAPAGSTESFTPKDSRKSKR